MKKRVNESLTEQIQIVMPEHSNGHGRLFGGRLVEWIDVVAGVVARRHSNRHVTTASNDNLSFRSPAFLNDTIVLYGRITYVGNTSMEVRVDVYVESLDGSKHLVNTAYLTMVALDDDQKPTPVPGLILETDDERAAWSEGEKRKAMRKSL
jgi:acyl-CoA hydrolase